MQAGTTSLTCLRWKLLVIAIALSLPGHAQIILQFQNRVGKEALKLDTPQYHTRKGYAFGVSLLQYFISNIEFQSTSRKPYTIPKKQSFYCVRQQVDSSRTISLSVPDGRYTGISFIVGIDSLTSTLPLSERTGVLDPGGDMVAGESMYWVWNTGYIFFKMEGTSPAVPADPTGFHEFQYHIGGYGGYNSPTINNIRRVTLQFPRTIVVKRNRPVIVPVVFDVLKVFDGKEDLDLPVRHHIMLATASSIVANNYSGGFFVDEPARGLKAARGLSSK